MNQSACSSNRIARFLIGGLLVVAAGSVLVAPAATSAAACQGCLVVSAPTIGLYATAQPGLQDVIDQEGGVAVYTPLTTGTVGGPGTLCLVGHRTTHGSIFNRVPTLQPGDSIDLIDDAGAHRYVVSRLLVVSESGFRNDVDINDMSRSMLILQTSHPDSHLRYLIEAFGAGLVPPPVSSDAAMPAATTPESTAPASTAPATTVTPVTTPITNSPVPSTTPESGRPTKFGSIKSDA